jgi:hypothetical protein
MQTLLTFDFVMFTVLARWEFLKVSHKSQTWVPWFVVSELPLPHFSCENVLTTITALRYYIYYAEYIHCVFLVQFDSCSWFSRGQCCGIGCQYAGITTYGIFVFIIYLSLFNFSRSSLYSQYRNIICSNFYLEAILWPFCTKPLF